MTKCLNIVFTCTAFPNIQHGVSGMGSRAIYAVSKAQTDQLTIDGYTHHQRAIVRQCVRQPKKLSPGFAVILWSWDVLVYTYWSEVMVSRRKLHCGLACAAIGSFRTAMAPSMPEAEQIEPVRAQKYAAVLRSTPPPASDSAYQRLCQPPEAKSFGRWRFLPARLQFRVSPQRSQNFHTVLQPSNLGGERVIKVGALYVFICNTILHSRTSNCANIFQPYSYPRTVPSSWAAASTALSRIRPHRLHSRPNLMSIATIVSTAQRECGR